MKAKIIELHKNTTHHSRLKYEYTTNQHYQLQISHTKKSWTAKLTLKPLPEPVRKEFQDELFANHVTEPRAFAATINNEPVGWIELGHEKWNNRMRIWELLVRKEHRRKSIGTQLMKHAIKISKQKAARMLILETQSCNVDAIRFYLAHGFQLIGFDTAAYSNQDIEKGEIRLELGLKL